MRRELGIDHRIAAVAGRQGGTIARGQLVALGLSHSAIDRRIRAGRLHPLHRGVFAVGHRVVEVLGRRWAAVLACGPGAMLSHRHAGAAWDVRRTRAQRDRRHRAGDGPREPAGHPHALATVVAGRRDHDPRRATDHDSGAHAAGPRRRRAPRPAPRSGGGQRRAQAPARLRRPARAARALPGPPWDSLPQSGVGAVPRRRHTQRARSDRRGAVRCTRATAAVGELRHRGEGPRLLLAARQAGGRGRFVLVHRSPSALDDDRERDVELTFAGYRSLVSPGRRPLGVAGTSSPRSYGRLRVSVG